MEEIKESIKSAVIKRFDSPLFGFMFLSWLVANWSNILFLIFSKKTIEERIFTLSNFKMVDYFNFVFFPLFIGVLLAIIYPYAQIWLENKHRKAFEVWRVEEKNKTEKALQTIIDLADLKARADNATEEANSKIHNDKVIQQHKQDAELELIKAKQAAEKEIIDQEMKTRIKHEENQQLRSSNSIMEITNNINQLKGQLTIVENRIVLKENELLRITEEFDMMVSAFKDVITNVKSYHDIADSKSLVDVTRNIITIINDRVKGFRNISELNSDDLSELFTANEKMEILEKSRAK